MSESAVARQSGEAALGHADALAPELTARDGFSLVVGVVIGSGIYLVPGAVATHLASLRSVLAVWIVGGLLTLFGALSLAEMGAMFPAAGGLYAYLREAYGKPVAFLYGWGLLSMIQTGSIATLAAGFGLYLGQLLALTSNQQTALAASAVLTLTALNLLSLRHSKHIQNVATGAKILGLFALGALLFRRGHAANLRAGWTAPEHAGILSAGAALVGVLWAYEGWHAVSFTAGEFREPRRDLPRSLVSGTAMVAAIYILMNVAYYAVLTPGRIAGMGSAAAGAMQAVYGAGAVRLVSALILISILGAMNATILTGPRVYYAMARDGVFFAALAKTSAKNRVPALAIVVQGLWAAGLTLAGTYQQLFTYVIFTAWIFYGLAVAGVIVLRIKAPARRRTFRTPLYPLLPILFVLAAAGIVVATIAADPFHALLGAGAILIGLPLYFLFARRSRLQHFPE